MNDLFAYLLSANILLLVVVLYYRLLLSRQRRFVWNRAFLLAGSGLAFILPLLHVTSPAPAIGDLAVVRTLPEVIIGTAGGAESTVSGASAILPVIYLAAAGLLALLFFLRLGKLVRLILISPRERKDDYVLIRNAGPVAPASFLNFLFWSGELDNDPQSAEVILAHERCHIRQRHSLDLLWAELLRVVCWFNPAVYQLQRDLRCTHEFLADHAATQVGGKQALSRIVLARQFGPGHFTIANHFQSQIKARITMLKTKTGHKALVRYLLILPLAGLMFACTSMDQETAQGDISPELATNSQPTSNLIAPADGKSEDAGLVDGGTPPQPKNLMEIYQKIGYPEQAKEKGLEGKVIVKVLVNKKGTIEEHEILKDGPAVFREAVEKHLYEVEFEPGMKNDKPVRTWVTIPFAFKMG